MDFLLGLACAGGSCLGYRFALQCLKTQRCIYVVPQNTLTGAEIAVRVAFDRFPQERLSEFGISLCAQTNGFLEIMRKGHFSSSVCNRSNSPALPQFQCSDISLYRRQYRMARLSQIRNQLCIRVRHLQILLEALSLKFLTASPTLRSL